MDDLGDRRRVDRAQREVRFRRLDAIDEEADRFGMGQALRAMAAVPDLAGEGWHRVGVLTSQVRSGDRLVTSTFSDEQ